MDNKTKKKLYEILKKYYGYDDFRDGQFEAIDAILSGRDISVIMPTGGGKSLIYQIAAQINKGFTLVISPLIALMKDQVDGLNEIGVNATFINSSLSDTETESREEGIIAGEYDMLYLAPEKLSSFAIRRLFSICHPSIIAVDEAHCVSRWGHDFRPDYLRIGEFIEDLDIRPVVAALTATATPDVQVDIISQLNLDHPKLINNGFNRENLVFRVYHNSDKMNMVKHTIDQHPDKPGIIYASTRKTTESIAAQLSSSGYSAQCYHAGLPAETRTSTQDNFLYDKTRIIVATNAFGMGIDKPNVAFVIHYNIPGTIEEYYQEAGRAGRNGEDAECILLFNNSDVLFRRRLINMSDRDDVHKNLEKEKLQRIVDYGHTSSCLPSFIRNYFGDTNNDRCGKCDCCIGENTMVDITVDAQKVLSGIVRASRIYSYGRTTIVDALRGSKAEKILSSPLSELTIYGIMKDSSKEYVRAIMDYMVAEGYATITIDEYQSIGLSAKGKEWLQNTTTLTMLLDRIPKTKKKKPKEFDYDIDFDEELYDRLSQMRKKLASDGGMPAFMILSNATIRNIAAMIPKNKHQLLTVNGIGEVKLKKYGADILNVIDEYLNV